MVYYSKYILLIAHTVYFTYNIRSTHDAYEIILFATSSSLCKHLCGLYSHLLSTKGSPLNTQHNKTEQDTKTLTLTHDLIQCHKNTRIFTLYKQINPHFPTDTATETHTHRHPSTHIQSDSHTVSFTLTHSLNHRETKSHNFSAVTSY